MEGLKFLGKPAPSINPRSKWVPMAETGDWKERATHFEMAIEETEKRIMQIHKHPIGMFNYTRICMFCDLVNRLRKTRRG